MLIVEAAKTLAIAVVITFFNEGISDKKIQELNQELKLIPD